MATIEKCDFCDKELKADNSDGSKNFLVKEYSFFYKNYERVDLCAKCFNKLKDK